MRAIFAILVLLHIHQLLHAQHADCKSVEHHDKNQKMDPIIKKTCRYGNIKTISTGTPDEMGRYSWSYKIFLKTKTKENQVTLSDLFGNNADEVQAYLNKEVMKEYKHEMQYPELVECLKTIKLRTYQLDEFRLSFPENDLIHFWIEGRTSGACRNVSLGLATMTYQQFDSLKRINSK